MTKCFSYTPLVDCRTCNANDHTLAKTRRKTTPLRRHSSFNLESGVSRRLHNVQRASERASHSPMCAFFSFSQASQSERDAPKWESVLKHTLAGIIPDWNRVAFCSRAFCSRRLHCTTYIRTYTIYTHWVRFPARSLQPPCTLYNMEMSTGRAADYYFVNATRCARPLKVELIFIISFLSALQELFSLNGNLLSALRVARSRSVVVLQPKREPRPRERERDHVVKCLLLLCAAAYTAN